MDKKVIDNGEIEPKKEVTPVREMILWWEKRRIIYNAFLIALTLFSFYNFWDYPVRKIVGGQTIVLRAIGFVLLANLFYTSSWIFGVLGHRFLKLKGLTNTGRWVLFVIGTLISLFITNIYFVLEFDALFAN